MAALTDFLTSRPLATLSTYALLAAWSFCVGLATPVIFNELIAAPLNVGVLVVPKPNEVLAISSVSNINVLPLPTIIPPLVGVKPAILFNLLL